MSKKIKYSLALLATLSIGNTAIVKNHGRMKFLGTLPFENLLEEQTKYSK